MNTLKVFFFFLLSPPDPEQFDLDYIKETREIFHRNFFEQMIFHLKKKSKIFPATKKKHLTLEPQNSLNALTLGDIQ